MAELLLGLSLIVASMYCTTLYCQREALAKELSQSELDLEIAKDERLKFARAYASHPSNGSSGTCCDGIIHRTGVCTVHALRLEK